jgi:hypothetical protein
VRVKAFRLGSVGIDPPTPKNCAAITELERPRSEIYGGSGVQAESGLGKEPVDERGPVLDALEPVPDDGGQLIGAAGGKVAQAVLSVRPDALNRIHPSWVRLVHT